MNDLNTTFGHICRIVCHLGPRCLSPFSSVFSPVPGATGNGILLTNERREDVCVTNQRPGLREDSSEDLLGPGQADNSWELAP